MQSGEARPRVTTRVDWKNLFIVFFLGSTLIFLGIAAFYNIQLSKLNTAANEMVKPAPSTGATTSSNQATTSSNTSSPSAETAE